MVRKFTKVSLALIVLASSVGYANAATSGDPVTKTLDLTFEGTGTTIMDLQPNTANLSAGGHADGTVYANGTMSSPDAPTAQMAVRFTPGVGQKIDSTSVYRWRYTGANGNILNVHLSVADMAGSDNSGWILGPANQPNGTFTVEQYQNGTVAPDTYTISIDGAVYAV